MIALGREFPGVRILLLLTVLPVLVSAAVTTACAPKMVRIKVTEEDIVRANTSSSEGDVAFSRRDYYAALIKYLDSIRLNPNNELVWNRIGITYAQLKYYSEAAIAFQRSIQLNHKYPFSVNNLGSVYFAVKDYKKAEKQFKKAIGMSSKEASFHMNLGALYFEKKKTDRAMLEWRKGLALDPDILSKHNAISLAIGSDNAALKERYFYMARLFASAGNAAKAIENLQQALLNGFSDLEAIQKNPDFDPVRKDPDFIKFVSQDVPIWIKKQEQGAGSQKPE
jgi:tetratricopeptide (TPR) repeat protein